MENSREVGQTSHLYPRQGQSSTGSVAETGLRSPATTLSQPCHLGQDLPTILALSGPPSHARSRSDQTLYNFAPRLEISVIAEGLRP